ncbi:MAG: hypothetical protein RAP03_17165 [Candidatus Electryonea clarkiae]|nr:hypothetical protein [Candidatus Electryonea clarkiae]
MDKEKNNEIHSSDSMIKESSLGFPIGRVAKSIREVIGPSLSNHDVECISIVLVSHLMIEERINSLIVIWLTKHLPEMSSENKQGVPVNDVAMNEIAKYVDKLDFVKKLDFIKPLGTLLWGDDSKDIFKDFFKINNARIEIAHRLDIKSIKIGSKSLNTETGIEKFLDLAQQRLLNVSDLIELIDG